MVLSYLNPLCQVQSLPSQRAWQKRTSSCWRSTVSSRWTCRRRWLHGSSHSLWPPWWQNNQRDRRLGEENSTDISLVLTSADSWLCDFWHPDRAALNMFGKHRWLCLSVRLLEARSGAGNLTPAWKIRDKARDMKWNGTEELLPLVMHAVWTHQVFWTPSMVGDIF